MSNLKDYKLRFRLLVDSNDDIVMRWLWKYSIRDRYKEYLMPCLKACWLPRALIESQATNKEIQIAAADGVLWLERQIDYLRKLGGLSDQNPPPVVKRELQNKSTTTETAIIPEDIETGLGAWG